MPAAAVTDIIQIHPGIWTSSRWLRTPPPPNPRPSSVGAAATDNITPLDPAVSFLQQLRPGGPWTLTAIVPDGAATTVTALTAIAATAFVREHDGRRNLYYAPNPLKKAMWKKATKKDVAGAEFVWADLDPAKGETADAAKARILMAIDAEALPPSLVVDSGNGIQALWRLDAAVLFTSSEAWEDVESRILTLTLRLGGGAGTQNVDRILRLPGTTNLPNAKKIKDGRAACPTRLLRWDNSIHPLSAFPPPVRRTEEKAKADADDNVDDAGALDLSAIDDATSARLRAAIATGSIPGRQPESRSEVVFYAICELIRAMVPDDVILTTMLDRRNKISEHIHEQPTTEAACQTSKKSAATFSEECLPPRIHSCPPALIVP